MIKKIIAVFAMLMFSFPLVFSAACKKPAEDPGAIVKDHDEEEDINKTQIYMGSGITGSGGQWVNNLISNFESEYAGKSFAPGKTGVQIHVETDGILYGTELNHQLSSSDKDIFFSSFSRVKDFIDSDGNTPLLDITDAVTEPLSEMGEDRSIEDKLTESDREYFNINGKYYGIPYLTGFTGIVYDVDLFDSKSLYFKKNGKIGAKLNDADIGDGPDGIPGTYDDGLPQTYEDFFRMCDVMKNNKSITPFIWAGQYTGAYTKYPYNLAFNDYEGAARSSLQYNADEINEKNYIDIITGFDADGNPVIKENVEITRANFREIAKQPGRYYALKFWEQIVRNKYYHRLSIDDSESHLMAQAEFLESTMGPDKIAMILEGTWWQNEATSVFNDMVAIDESYSKTNRRFGFLPMPKVDKSRLGKPTLLDAISNIIIARSEIDDEKKDAVKAFIRYCCRNDTLKMITKEAGILSILDYTISDEELSACPYFTQFQFRMKSAADIVCNRFHSNAAKSFMRECGCYDIIDAWSSVKEDGHEKLETDFVKAMIYRNVTAIDYFNGLYSYVTK